MAKSKLFPIAALAASLMASPVQALTGNELTVKCQSDNVGFQHACTMYVTGVFDALVWTEEISKDKKLNLCEPDSITYGQLQAVGLKAMRDNPADNHWLAATLLTRAWVQAWPCEGGAK